MKYPVWWRGSLCLSCLLFLKSVHDSCLWACMCSSRSTTLSRYSCQCLLHTRNLSERHHLDQTVIMGFQALGLHTPTSTEQPAASCWKWDKRKQKQGKRGGNWPARGAVSRASGSVEPATARANVPWHQGNIRPATPEMHGITLTDNKPHPQTCESDIRLLNSLSDFSDHFDAHTNTQVHHIPRQTGCALFQPA